MSVREPGVALDELLRALKRRGIPLPFEIGTFLVLEVSERLARAPAKVVASDVRLDDDGQLTLDGGAKSSDEEACRALLELLGDLLVRSAPGVPEGLLGLVESGPSEGRWTLAQLRDDLEASLVPLNRSATRRVLARIVREGRREDDGGATRVSFAPSVGALDAEVDGVLGAAPEAERPSGERALDVSAHARRLEPHAPVPVERALGRAEAGAAGLEEFERVASAQGASGVVVGLAVAALAAAAVAAYLLWGG